MVSRIYLGFLVPPRAPPPIATPALRRARDCLQSRRARLGSRGPATSSDRAYRWILGSRLLGLRPFEARPSMTLRKSPQRAPPHRSSPRPRTSRERRPRVRDDSLWCRAAFGAFERPGRWWCTRLALLLGLSPRPRAKPASRGPWVGWARAEKWFPARCRVRDDSLWYRTAFGYFDRCSRERRRQMNGYSCQARV